MAQLIKIDKNGSKHFAGMVKCDRCGGQGGSDAWAYTGWTCYKCGGTGSVSATWIERTPEYQAKLDARREAKNAKKRAEAEAAAERRERARIAAEESARAAEERRAREEAERKARSQYVGEVGAKLTTEATYLGSPHYTSHIGWKEQTVYVHTFVDAAGNKLVWKSGTFPFSADEGSAVTISGSVKSHDDYKGEKQTALIRCKVRRLDESSAQAYTGAKEIRHERR